MLKVRVIPTLLWKDLGLVKGIAFDSWRRVGPVLPAIKVYNARDVDELILVDITASRESATPDYESVSEFASECFVPLTVGGGINSIDHIQRLLRAGADKICINTAAYGNPRLIDEASTRFGAQCVVVSVDVRRVEDDRYLCFSHAGTIATDKEPVAWVKEMQDRGAGEILITSVERDGSMQGYDLGLIEQIARNVSIPVIASGGAGNYEHFRQAIEEGGAAAVAAASMFHFTEQTPADAKNYLNAAGIPVRIHGFVGAVYDRP